MRQWLIGTLRERAISGSLGARVLGAPAQAAAPRPPFAGLLVRDGAFRVGFGEPGTYPLAATRITTVDSAGRRITVTRAALLGVAAIGVRKRLPVSLILQRDDGATHTVHVSGARRSAALEWAVRFNAWRDAQAEPIQIEEE